MIIYPERITQQPLEFEESLPASVLELEEPLVAQHEPIKASLTVLRDGESLIVTGQLRTTLKVKCGRCAEWMDWPIHVKRFLLHLEPPLSDTIDLTPQIREDILLDLPVAASCRLDKEWRCPITGQLHPEASEPPAPIRGGDAWKELDKLKDRVEG
jgi:uncharacterized metal-binding protein YceD (DUF177 family)